MLKKDQVELIPLFPTTVVKVSLGRYFTKKEHQFFTSHIPMWKDEQGGMFNHQSKDRYLFDSHVDILGDIKKDCEHFLKQYMEEIEGVNTNLTGIRITQSWLNKNKPSEQHYPHSHSNSYLSGVLYLKCLPNDCINFNNRMRGLYNNIEFPTPKYTGWNANIVKVDVEEGILILFPSYMLHYVDVNDTEDKERMSLAFNTFPIGELGEYNGANHLKL